MIHKVTMDDFPHKEFGRAWAKRRCVVEVPELNKKFLDFARPRETENVIFEMDKFLETIDIDIEKAIPRIVETPEYYKIVVDYYVRFEL